MFGDGFLKKFLGVFCTALVFSCTYDPLEDNTALSELVETNAFVRFDNRIPSIIEISPDGVDTIAGAIQVQFPSPAIIDVAVNFALAGSAEYNKHYFIEGATSTGGTVEIMHDPTSTISSFTDLVIMILPDTSSNFSRSIILELVSATASDGRSVDVGQGAMHKGITVFLKK